MTQGQGKVRAVAKGVRKTRSRFGGRLEPFSHVDLSLYRGRELDIVTQAEVVTPSVPGTLMPSRNPRALPPGLDPEAVPDQLGWRRRRGPGRPRRRQAR
jgi:Recombination protein O N terminal